MHRRAAAFILILAGLILVVLPFAERLFSKTGPFEALTDDFRPIMQPASIAAFQQDVETLKTLPTAVNTTLIPTFAQLANVTPAQFGALLATRYPAVAGGLTAIPAIAPQLEQTVNALASQQDDFAKVDAIPTKSISTTGIPWAILGAGIIALVSGFAMLGSSWVPAFAALLLGAALVGVPLVTSMPSKSAAASKIIGSNEVLLTRANAESLRQATQILKAMGDEFQTKLIPELAAQFNIPPAQLTSNPTVAAIATNLPAGLQRLDGAVSLIDDNAPRYQAIKSVSFSRITWIAIGTGIAALIAGLIGLLGAQRGAAVGEHRRRIGGRREKEAAA